MATVRQRSNGSWEVRISRKTLPKAIYLTFDSEEEGRREAAKIERLLDLGVVPPEFLQDPNACVTIGDAIKEYRATCALSPSGGALLDVLDERNGVVRLSSIDYAWAESWVRQMKTESFLKPTTIKHYVGELSRCFEWLSHRYPRVFPSNPLLTLPRRYAAYSEKEQQLAVVTHGKRINDEERFRRLDPDEEVRVRAIMGGERPANRQRPFELPHAEALQCIFDVALETGMRLREIYTLRIDQVQFRKRTIVVEKTKTDRARQVPMTSVCEQVLSSYLGDRRSGLVFPWWDGCMELSGLNRITSKLSRQFGRIFDAAECKDLSFHDLRHEAISRFYERTTLDSAVIQKFVGHISEKAHARYMNLRGASFRDRLW
nr:tyrosine-type recombinase/integrase [Zoogloeaceae bacterium]